MQSLRSAAIAALVPDIHAGDQNETDLQMRARRGGERRLTFAMAYKSGCTAITNRLASISRGSGLAEACQKRRPTRTLLLPAEVEIFEHCQARQARLGWGPFWHTPSVSSQLQKRRRLTIFEKKRPDGESETKRGAPPEWRGISDHLMMVLALAAIQGSGQRLIGFTLNLSPEIEARARDAENLKDFIRRRVMEAVEKVLGSKPMVAFVIEESSQGAMHLHGLIAGPNLTRRSRGPLKAALRLAGGQMPEGREEAQVAFNRREIDLGWIGYMLKDVKFDLTPAEGWRAAPVFISQRALQGAKELFEELRTLVKDSRS